MKFTTLCPLCIQEKPENVLQGTLKFNDSGIYQITCNRGHLFNTVLKEHKYDVLFEIAMQSYLDGNLIQAIATFAASLERYYEFFVKVTLLNRGIDKSEIENSWKEVKKHSERQQGAFIFIFLAEFKKHPDLLSPKVINKRNNVIHNGEIPTEETALEYGQAVLDVIVNNHKVVMTELKDAITSYDNFRFELANKTVNKHAQATVHHSIGSIITYLCLMEDKARPSLTEILSDKNYIQNLGKASQIPFDQQ